MLPVVCNSIDITKSRIWQTTTTYCLALSTIHPCFQGPRTAVHRNHLSPNVGSRATAYQTHRRVSIAGPRSYKSRWSTWDDPFVPNAGMTGLMTAVLTVVTHWPNLHRIGLWYNLGFYIKRQLIYRLYLDYRNHRLQLYINKYMQLLNIIDRVPRHLQDFTQQRCNQRIGSRLNELVPVSQGISDGWHALIIFSSIIPNFLVDLY